MHTKSAFSLVELMVAGAIVGILVMLALPRYQAFTVKARRGEAKSNLSHLRSLQAAYKIDYFDYYRGAPMIGVKGIGYKDGLGRTGDHACAADPEVDKGLCNHLGFEPEALGELRYFYQFRDDIPGQPYVAVASGASDGNKHIYPDCDGAGPVECGYPKGDTVTLAIGSKNSPVVCRNITKHCPRGVAPPPPPPPPTCSCGAWISGTPTLVNTAIVLANECECKTFARQRTDTRVCTHCPATTPTTRTVTLASVKGTKSINSSTTAECPCNCAPGDTRSACVSCNIVSDTTSTCSATGLSNKYLCEEVAGTKTRTIDRDPNSATCQDTTTTLNCTVCGTKTVTLPSWTLGSWGTCERNNSQTNSAAADYCQQTATDNRSCNDPCSGLGSTTCPAPPYNCSGTRTRTQNCIGCATCSPASQCCNGTTPVMTKPSGAYTHCTWGAGTYHTSDRTYGCCTCNQEQACRNTSGGSWNGTTCTNTAGDTWNYTSGCEGSFTTPSCGPAQCCHDHDSDGSTPDVEITSCPDGQELQPFPNCCVDRPRNQCSSQTQCCNTDTDPDTVVTFPTALISQCSSDNWKGTCNGSSCETASSGCCVCPSQPAGGCGFPKIWQNCQCECPPSTPTPEQCTNAGLILSEEMCSCINPPDCSNQCCDADNNRITSDDQCPTNHVLRAYPDCCQCDTSTVCCNNNTVISQISGQHCKYWRGDYTSAAGCCTCEEEQACRNNPTARWTGSACKHYMDSPDYTWHYTSGCTGTFTYSSSCSNGDDIADCGTEGGNWQNSDNTCKCPEWEIWSYDTNTCTGTCTPIAKNSTCLSKYYFSGYLDTDIVHGDYYNHSDYDTDTDHNNSSCLCDGRRNFIPNRGAPHTTQHGIRLGGCVCRGNHREVTEGGVKKCKSCGDQHLREEPPNSGVWRCRSCDDLSALLKLGKISYGSTGKIEDGYECSCAKYMRDGHRYVDQTSGKVTQSIQNGSNTDLGITFESWRAALNSWTPKPSGLAAVPDSVVLSGYGYDHAYFRAMLWNWYVKARIEADRLSMTPPPIPAALITFYDTTYNNTTGKSTYAPIILSRTTDLHLITCTMATWAE